MDYANKLSKISFFFKEIYLLTLVFFLIARCVITLHPTLYTSFPLTSKQ